jgi:type III secretory pathway component EscS
MIHKLLKARHWKIFILIFIIPYSLQFIAMYISKDSPELMLTFTPIIIIIFFICFFGWLYSVAIGLQTKTPDSVKMKIKKFKFLLLIPMIYIPFIFGLMTFITNFITQSDGSTMTFIIPIMLVFHLLSMFGLFYSFYFTAKTLKTVELNREVTFSDFAGDFFLFLFFPIGVWVIQPRVNQIIN